MCNVMESYGKGVLVLEVQARSLDNLPGYCFISVSMKTNEFTIRFFPPKFQSAFKAA